MIVVVDASVLADVLLRTPDAVVLRAKLFQSENTLYAPHLIDLEITQVFRRHVAQHIAQPDRCQAALQDLARLRLLRYPHHPLLSRIWELRHNLSAYDAAYVALAESLEATLVTRDRRVANAAGHRARIELV